MGKSAKLYHSKLRERGPTVMRFKSDPTDGKYGPYCFVQLEGETEDRLFTLDSDLVREEVERTRSVKGDDWVEVRAEGMKQGATIMVTEIGTAGAPVLPDDGNGRQPQDGPPPNFPDQAKAPPANTAREALNGSNVSRAVAMTVEAIEGLKGAGIPIDSDAAARVYSTHFIQTSRG